MTRIISISDDAYEELSKLKKELSFSQIIITLTKMKKRLHNEICEIVHK